ncbi:MAG: molybdate ABC transporter substrate-binding protein, partial [Anaerolineae bacterium]|nr:molybdate ABC transporter substrate-binding protein [Anaerolineae bacterium]
AQFYANVVIEGANVRQVVTQVALGEADAGVVYASDVTPDVADDLAILDVPDEFNVIAEYPLVLLRDSANSELAREFIAFLLSDAGQDLFVKWGFSSIRPAKSWGWSVICEANPEWSGCG